MKKFETYRIWRRSEWEKNTWIPTIYTVKGRTDKEAWRNMERSFKHGEFKNMTLIALPLGQHP